MFNAKVILISLFAALFCGATQLYATNKVLLGRVVDSVTKEALYGSTIADISSGRGAVSDFNGEFAISLTSVPSKIVITQVGYVTREITIEDVSKPLNITLTEDPILIGEVVVKRRRRLTKDEYAWLLHSKIADNAERNNPDFINPMRYSDYQRTSVFYVQRNKEAKLDVDLADKIYVPVILDEKLTKIERTPSDKEQNRQVLTRRSDVLLETMKTHLDFILEGSRATTDLNFYYNQLVFFGRAFPSPLSKSANLYYRLYLTDSTSLNGRKEYKFNYFPKSKHSTSFKGGFKVDSLTWAVTEIDAILPPTANLNFISNFKTKAIYKQTLPNGRWFKDKQTSELEMSLSNETSEAENKLLHFKIRLMNSYIPLLNNEHNELQSPDNQEHLLLAEREKAPMDASEQQASEEINRLKQKHLIVAMDRVANAAVTTYLNAGPIDLGPYSMVYRSTLVEGMRLALPFRTSAKLSQKFSVGGHISYATDLEDFGYGANVHFRLPSKRRSILSAAYADDYYNLSDNIFSEFISENAHDSSANSSMSSILTYDPNPYMLRKQSAYLSFERDLSSNFTLNIRPIYERYFANEVDLHYVPHVLFNQGLTSYKHFDTQSLLLDLRFSKGQGFSDTFFDHVYYDTQKPIFHFSILAGRYNLQGESKGEFYSNLNVSVKQRQSFGPMTLSSVIEAGAILGDVPYLLLDRAKGSGDYGMAEYNFNVLSHASFASDIYAHAYINYNMGGVLFNKLPLIRRLNLREIFTFKGYYGDLLQDHNSVLEMPSYLHEPDEIPYMEFSAGVGNIFRFFQVEYVVTPNDYAVNGGYAKRHGVRFQAELTF